MLNRLPPSEVPACTTLPATSHPDFAGRAAFATLSILTLNSAHGEPLPSREGGGLAAVHGVRPDNQALSAVARHAAKCVTDSGDVAHSSHFIVDRRSAAIHVFDELARLSASSAVLLGAARGDHSVPDVALPALASIAPAGRTTPAGRLIAETGRNLCGVDIVWVDVDTAISMHRVRTIGPEERQLEQLDTAQVAAYRISSGCTNVPVAFHESPLRPIFSVSRAVAYVLPEIESLQRMVGSCEVLGARYGKPGRSPACPEEGRAVPGTTGRHLTDAFGLRRLVEQTRGRRSDR